MKNKLRIFLIVFAFLANLLIAFTPLYSMRSAPEPCEEAPSCANNGGKLCATVEKGHVTYYCYYG